MHITHHYIPGLRFDSCWTYATRLPTGRSHWSRLPQEDEQGVALDPHGAWWCARRCGAVLGRKPWQTAWLPQDLALQPDARELSQALQALGPAWAVTLDEGHAQAPLLPCADALFLGGSALLQLQFKDQSDGPQRPFWAWVVGVELQESLRHAGRHIPQMAPGHPRALLVLPFGWRLPWYCGSAVRVQTVDGSLCVLDGLNAQWRETHSLAVITLAPGGGGAVTDSILA